MHLHRHGLTLSIATFALGFAAFGCKATVSTGEAAAPAPVAAAEPPAPVDSDGDGIPDDADACKDKAGKANADPTKHGCPEEPQVAMAAAVSHVHIEGNEVVIDEKIMFDTGKSTIKPESDKLLDEIAEVIKTQGQKIDLIEVGGHADKQGDEKANVKLTDDRAKAVVDALVKRGVDAKKLRARGYGEFCPADTADTPEAHEKNRRVQFAILKLDGKKTGVKLGCDEAAKKGIKPQPIF
jgi:outer membrane protein OmpA-like peptidoglycan-associated protein